MSRPKRARNVGEHPAQSAETIRAATTIKELMPDDDRRDVALAGIRAVVDHADEIWPRAVTPTRARRSRPRYLDVLQALSEGRNREEAAESLGISTQTLMTHSKHARAALRARNTLHAVAEALRQGLIE